MDGSYRSGSTFNLNSEDGDTMDVTTVTPGELLIPIVGEDLDDEVRAVGEDDYQTPSESKREKYSR